jgi:hypothetical protein
LQLFGQPLVAGRARLFDALVARRGEAVRLQRVQLVGDFLERARCRAQTVSG